MINKKEIQNKIQLLKKTRNMTTLYIAAHLEGLFQTREEYRQAAFLSETKEHYREQVSKVVEGRRFTIQIDYETEPWFKCLYEGEPHDDSLHTNSSYLWLACQIEFRFNGTPRAALQIAEVIKEAAQRVRKRTKLVSGK